MPKLGVIGGSGLYAMPGLERSRSVAVSTPFGPPSDRVVVGEIGGTAVAFLPRHGRGHRIPPSDINYRANVFAMKKLGVECLLAVSAVGSLRRNIRPGDVVVPDQFLDWTRRRKSTFFAPGLVAHVAFADPVCAELAARVAKLVQSDAGRGRGARKVHRGGTYLCMEGPQFSTRAESHLYRAWGADVIGMTNVQEAKLAREAEICFATLAIATDYDCWNPDAGDVAVGEILRILGENTERARRVVAKLAGGLPDRRKCGCATALDGAIVTDPKRRSTKQLRELAPIVGRVLRDSSEGVNR